MPSRIGYDDIEPATEEEKQEFLDSLGDPELEEEEETWDEEDEDEIWDEEDEIYDSEGNVVWSRYYEGQFVDRVCQAQGCGRKFRGMSDHGYCSSCADKIERGWDIQ